MISRLDGNYHLKYLQCLKENPRQRNQQWPINKANCKSVIASSVSNPITLQKVTLIGRIKHDLMYNQRFR